MILGDKVQRCFVRGGRLCFAFVGGNEQQIAPWLHAGLGVVSSSEMGLAAKSSAGHFYISERMDSLLKRKGFQFRLSNLLLWHSCSFRYLFATFGRVYSLFADAKLLLILPK